LSEGGAPELSMVGRGVVVIEAGISLSDYETFLETE
jgi:hypothetical protein